ncbi:hypothetical protein FLJU110815_13600 [Flavobacterium jumunjinense]
MRSTTQFNILFASYSILIVVLVILFFNFQLRIIKGDTKNFHISFDDYSITEENPSCRIIIDDSIVYKSDKISEFDAIDIVLKNGKHKFEVSDLCNNYCVKDSIIIKNYPEMNIYNISFEYCPSYEEYLPIYRKQYFYRIIRSDKTEYDEEQYPSIMEQINQQIDVNYLKNRLYKPTDRRFKITFYDEPIYLD